MKKVSLSVISALLLLTGCTGGGDETTTLPPTPSPNPTPTPIPQTPETPVNNFNNNIQTPDGLIPSTNAQDRLNEISLGRNDPFDTITPPGVINLNSDQFVSESIASNKAIVKLPPKPVNQEVNATANNTSGSMGNNNLTNNQKDSTSGVNKKLSSPPVVVLPPVPNDAQNIIVSGIMNLNGENVALIQTPWDGITRPVRMGDIVSDSVSGISVRIKDINLGSATTIALRQDSQIILRTINNDNGVVILEQFGQNVTRQIGDSNIASNIAK